MEYKKRILFVGMVFKILKPDSGCFRQSRAFKCRKYLSV